MERLVHLNMPFEWGWPSGKCRWCACGLAVSSAGRLPADRSTRISRRAYSLRPALAATILARRAGKGTSTLWSPFRRLIVNRELWVGLRSMIETGISKSVPGLGAGMLLLVALAAPAAAQLGFPPSSAPGAPPRSQTCLRLESQLAGVDRAAVEPARADQIKRYEETIARQQAELDRLSQQAHRTGCQGSGFFALFSGQPAQCGPINNQIQQVRANLDRLIGELQRVQGNSADREAQRRSILVALGQSDCGPQYRQYATAAPGGGFFENLFGGVRPPASGPDAPLSGTYRTVCVRTCDGYYFPISYSTVPSKFAEDERLCQRLCPASEAVLYSHRNPGEDVTQSVSIGGQPYSALPNALSYRKQFNPACSCRAPGQSWAEALRQLDDQTIERGDIVVTEEKAKLLSQPRVDAQGKPISLDANPPRPAPAPKGAGPKSAAAAPSPPPAAATSPTPEEKVEEDPTKRKVRAVGPSAYPVR